MKEYFDVLNENGEFTGEVASREKCHIYGLYHKAVVLFIINSNGDVLLQQRSANKKLWPNLWDITAGGHVLKDEFGYEAVIRETKEEIGLDLEVQELLFIGCTRSTNMKKDFINRHFNEFYIAKKDINLSNLILQEEEVQDIKWVPKEEILKRINHNYDQLTDKISCWQYLEKYLNSKNKIRGVL